MEREADAVVVAIDGSNAALQAADWAIPEAVYRFAALRLVFATPEQGPAMRDRARCALATAYGRVTSRAPRLDVETAYAMGGSVEAFIEESAHASMLCIGTTGHHGTPLDANTTAIVQRAHCPVALIRERAEDAADDEVVAVVLDDASDNDAVVHQAMAEGRLRKATVRMIDRRTDSWVRRYPDVPVQMVAAGCGPPAGRGVTRSLSQLAVVGRADTGHIGEITAPNCHPIVGYPDCSVLFVRT